MNIRYIKPKKRHKRTHETSRVCLVSPDFTINLDMPLHKDGDDFTVRQSVLQLVPYDQDERKTLPRLVRSRRRLGSLKEKQDPEQFKTQVTNGLSDTSLRQRKTYEGTTKFVKIPVLGGIEPLQMLLQSPRLQNFTFRQIRSEQTKAKETDRVLSIQQNAHVLNIQVYHIVPRTRDTEIDGK